MGKWISERRGCRKRGRRIRHRRGRMKTKCERRLGEEGKKKDQEEKKWRIDWRWRTNHEYTYGWRGNKGSRIAQSWLSEASVWSLQWLYLSEPLV